MRPSGWATGRLSAWKSSSIITVPAGAAQAVADGCVAAGVRAIQNLAPTKLTVPPDVRLHYADVGLELQQLAYCL